MKRGLNYLIVAFLIAIIATGCTKSTPYTQPPTTFPIGSFIGPLTLIHKNSATSKLDTSTAVVQLIMTANETFSMGGDTSKIQAPSYGSFDVNNITNILTFYDATVTKTTNLNGPKKHLNGPFLFTYDSSNTLHIYGSSDTLSFDYAFKTF